MPDDHKEFCSRCRREAPLTGSRGAQGWTYVEDERGNLRELLCPGCHTPDDVDANWPDFPPDDEAA